MDTRTCRPRRPEHRLVNLQRSLVDTIFKPSVRGFSTVPGFSVLERTVTTCSDETFSLSLGHSSDRHLLEGPIVPTDQLPRGLCRSLSSGTRTLREPVSSTHNLSNHLSNRPKVYRPTVGESEEGNVYVTGGGVCGFGGRTPESSREEVLWKSREGRPEVSRNKNDTLKKF